MKLHVHSNQWKKKSVDIYLKYSWVPKSSGCLKNKLGAWIYCRFWWHVSTLVFLFSKMVIVSHDSKWGVGLVGFFFSWLRKIVLQWLWKIKLGRRQKEVDSTSANYQLKFIERTWENEGFPKKNSRFTKRVGLGNHKTVEQDYRAPPFSILSSPCFSLLFHFAPQTFCYAMQKN